MDDRIASPFDLRRRTLLKGAAATAAAAFAGPVLAGSPTPADRYLWIQANLAGSASRPDLTRVFPTGPERQFIEFATKPAVFASPTRVTNTRIDVFVPRNSVLYFSDNPPPAPASASLGLIGSAPVLRRPDYAGRVMIDGSPVTITPGPGGVPLGISGQQKDGTRLAIKLDVVAAAFPGRQPGVNVSWAVCHATITSGAEPPLAFTFAFSPEALLACLSLTCANTSTSLIVDFADLVGSGGDFRFRRSALYYRHAFSAQTLNSPVQNGAAAMPLFCSPIGSPAYRIGAFAPALATTAPPAAPGVSFSPLGALDVGVSETRAGYLQRGRSTAAALLPALTSALADPSWLGVADLARWLGQAMVADESALRTAFDVNFDAFQALRKANPSSPVFTRKPTMLDSGTDQLSDQILDWVYDKTH